MSWISSIVGGLFNFGGSSLDALYSYDVQKRLMDRQHKWQERMANTAHQRQVKDMRAAGLNPILSATGGNGAATPVSSVPSGFDPGFSDVYKNTAQGASDLKRAFDTEQRKIAKELEIADATKNKINAETKQIKAETARTKNINQPIEKGTNLFNGVHDYVSHVFSPVSDAISGVHSAPAAKETQEYLNDLRNSRDSGFPIADPVGSQLQPQKFYGSDVYFGRYKKDGKIHTGYYIKRKGKTK